MEFLTIFIIICVIALVIFGLLSLIGIFPIEKLKMKRGRHPQGHTGDGIGSGPVGGFFDGGGGGGGGDGG